ncbi:hypothetical protein TRFO_10856 [Tritrichomonas foetus]|uniref:DOCKER Lobe A domain-containing protein n=1 Tax=Tritrichomonas foetus TaxID=1144522 RepID=A0A1J4J6P7_9EUKA|nr:hypothetical protein TRFO_10856 [Tritrichomonas foetus]|eukprot:OHS94906.1 hypothetical protein TRFO_10856 [Tritrichomonas foetus]
MFNIREHKSRRNTLNHDNIMLAMRVKVVSEPNEPRLISVSENELENLPWLHFLKSGKTSSFEIPRLIKPNNPKPPELQSEEDFTEMEKPSKKSKTAKGFVDFMNDPKSGSDYVSIPIINSRSKDSIARLAYKFNERPTPMNFLHISGVNFDITGLSTSVFMEFFVYDDKPITEAVQMKFSSQQGVFSRYGQTTKEIILPFPKRNDALLVCILYMPVPDAVTGDIVALPIGIGQQPILDLVKSSTLNPSFCYFDPTISLTDHFTREANMKYKIEFDAKITEKLLPESKPLVARLTSFSNMYPTPLLTFYGFDVVLKHKFNSKKSLSSHVYIRLTLKAPGENGKLQEVKMFAPSNADTTLLEKGETCRLPPKSGHLYFPDHLNFFVSPDQEEVLTAQVEVILVKSGKSKTLASHTFPINHPNHSFVNQKMDTKGNFLNMKYSFPTVYAPPKTVRPAILKTGEVIATKDEFYSEIAPYVINKNLQMDVFQELNFQQLFEMIPMNRMNEIQLWIEHYFTCQPGFTDVYTKKLTESVKIAGSFPLPFLLILFKSMCIEKKLDEASLNLLLSKCAEYCGSANESERSAFKASVADFIIQLRMAFRPDIVFRIAYKYLAQLSISDRLDVYTYLFYDIAFIQSLTFNCNVNIQAVISPYIPLFSLLYKTLNQTFTENKKEAVNAAADALSLLATTLEQYSNSETSSEIAQMIFPILPMIFTFYDSLITQLGDNTGRGDNQANGAVLMPIILFFLKNCDCEQFINYYNILSDDSQLRFLDFLCTLTDVEMIQQVAKNSQVEGNSELSIMHEVTIRILIFISFYEKIQFADERTLHSIFNLIIHMLLSTKQASESYALLFKSIAFFITRYPNLIFNEKTTLINQLMSAIVPLTQRKLHNARVGAIGFIMWLMELENEIRSDSSRCSLALQYATCEAFFSNENFISFYDQLPTLSDDVKKLYKKLRSAAEPTVHEQKIQALLDIASKDYKNFPAIRARILSHIVKLNQQNNDIPSAFVVQWRLCGFIAEVFKMKKQIVDGIPADGISAFPFIFDEPTVDLSAYPEHSAYLVMESEQFNETYISVALQNALELCQQAGFNWLISQVTEYLFDNLERRREFLLLKSLYESVSQSYTSLNESEKPNVEFSRIFISKNLTKNFRFTECIRISPIKKMEEFATLFGENAKASTETAPITESKNDDEYQILKVKFDIEQLRNLKATVFTKDIISKPGKDVDWEDTFVKRYIYTTEFPLPWATSYSKIISTRTKKISKEDFFEEKMKKFKDSFNKKLEAITAVLPPKKMISMWGQCVLGLNAGPLLHKIGKIVVSVKDNPQKHPYFELILSQHAKDYEGTVPEDVPKRITKLSNDIWKMMVDTVKLIDNVFALNKPPDEEKAMLSQYRKILNVPEPNNQISAH